jgi:hypothetical protein
MESFQRELRRHTLQYEAIQGTEWKKITNHIIKQYQKIDSPPFNTGFNMIVVQGPSANQTKYAWIIKILTWTTTTRHDLLSRNLWPKPETKLVKNSALCPCTPANGVTPRTHGDLKEIQTRQHHGALRHQN